MLTQGCYVYRPATLPVPDGSQVRVEGARLEIYDGTMIRPTPAQCHATQLYGALHYARGDTLVVGPVLGMRHASPKGGCRHVSTAAVVASPVATKVAVRHFSGWRTTGFAAGVVATATVVAGIIFIEAYGHADPNMRAPR
ncbi:MAG: hypothetical protein HOQ09_06670 [Gemmatimonadaceae bacterium]|nr:hypothetical protein [Gemmatimonadaceae bacterium]